MSPNNLLFHYHVITLVFILLEKVSLFCFAFSTVSRVISILSFVIFSSLSGTVNTLENSISFVCDTWVRKLYVRKVKHTSCKYVSTVCKGMYEYMYVHERGINFPCHKTRRIQCRCHCPLILVYPVV